MKYMENDIYDNIDDYVVEIEKELDVKKSTNYYLNPKNLMIEYNSCLEKNECSPKLIKYFENIARHFSRVYYYSSKNDLDACVNYAVSEAFRKWKKYNVKRSENIFSFFTTIIRNDLQTHYKYINKHKSEHISIESLFTNNQDR